MLSRDYTKEIGRRSDPPRVPLPIALLVLAIAGAAFWFGVAKIRTLPSAKQGAAETPAVVAKPAPQAHGAQP